MRELVVLSGKGGTGKTSLVGAFSALARNKVLCDADVDAADLHLLLQPEMQHAETFQGGHTAVIVRERCVECGVCRDLCVWNAVSEDYEVDSTACEGCGVCVHFCPEQAVEFLERTCGEWYVSRTRFGPLVHARLGIAEENSGKLVSLVRREARKLAEEHGCDLILTDGPPGISCPVIASIGGATAALIVTEPTVSGRHDLERVSQLAAHFQVPAFVVVNKADLNPDMCASIQASAGSLQVAFLGAIPFDRTFTDAMVEGKTVVEHNGSPSGTVVRALWSDILDRMRLLDPF